MMNTSLHKLFVTNGIFWRKLDLPNQYWAELFLSKHLTCLNNPSVQNPDRLQGLSWSIQLVWPTDEFVDILKINKWQDISIMLRSAVGKTHVLRSRLVMDYTTSYFPSIVFWFRFGESLVFRLYSEIDHLHLSSEAQCDCHTLPSDW